MPNCVSYFTSKRLRDASHRSILDMLCEGTSPTALPLLGAEAARTSQESRQGVIYIIYVCIYIYDIYIYIQPTGPIFVVFFKTNPQTITKCYILIGCVGRHAFCVEICVPGCRVSTGSHRVTELQGS